MRDNGNVIYDTVRNIDFWNVRNDFQDKLKEGTNELLSSKNFLRTCQQVTKCQTNITTDF